AIDETGAQLIPAGALDEQFANALRLSASDITIEPHGSFTLTVRVEKTAELSPGGHYAVLVLSQLGDASQIPAFRGAVAVNIFVVNSDGIKTGLKLLATRLSHNPFMLPRGVELDFRNDGNTHVVPRASVGIYSQDGTTLYSQAVINTSSLPLFPGKEHRYAADMQALDRRWLPGKLRALVSYRIDGSDIQLIQEFTFWYVPPIAIAVLLLICIVVWLYRRTLWKITLWIMKHLRRQYQKIRGTRSQRRTATKVKQRPASNRRRAVGRAAMQAHHKTSLSAAKQKASRVLGKVLVQKEPEVNIVSAKKIEVTTPKTSPPKKTTKPKSARNTSQTSRKKTKTTTATTRKKTAKQSKTGSRKKAA
ncbi:hypothetical protein KDA14_03375, partial [Candidatus Saccharibacteria bacterium]|nr:hypothetical protein [Candidatus Saccharibacteria bacterium]